MGLFVDDPIARDGAADPLVIRYRVLRRVLAGNSEMLERLSELEADLFHLDPGDSRIRQPVLELLDAALLLAEDLNILTGDRETALYRTHHDISVAVREALRGFRSPTEQPLLVSLSECGLAREREVGGKAARLGEVMARLPDRVPAGFVLTTAAYRVFLAENDLHRPIRRLMEHLTLVTEPDLFRHRTAELRRLVESSAVPPRIASAIAEGVMRFPMPWPAVWAVRSSAVGEDGRLSFAGQFDTVLGCPRDRLQDAYRRVLASRFSDRAVRYRLATGCTEVETPMAVLFMPMLEARAAGVLYTRDPHDEGADRMVISVVAGLAEDMVRGRVAGDSVVVSRAGEVIERTGAPSEPVLSPQDVVALVQVGLKVEECFGRPQDIEWVLGPDGHVSVVQARPLKVVDRRLHAGQAHEPRPALFEGGFTIFNFVNFRFRGGGAGPDRRALRAQFLADVLLNLGFAVDRREDLVTAWLRRHPAAASKEALAAIGRLMACARQLDMLMEGEASVRHSVECFLNGNYDAFG